MDLIQYEFIALLLGFLCAIVLGVPIPFRELNFSFLLSKSSFIFSEDLHFGRAYVHEAL